MSSSSDREEGEVSDEEITDLPPSVSRHTGRASNSRGLSHNTQTKRNGQAVAASSRRITKRNTVLESYRRASSSTPLLSSDIAPQKVPSHSVHQLVSTPSDSAHEKHSRRAHLDSSRSYNKIDIRVPTDQIPLHLGNSAKLNDLAMSFQRERAKKFVSMLHQNNYGFDQLVAEELDPLILRSIFQELHIPVNENNSGTQKWTSNVPFLGGDLLKMPQVDNESTRDSSKSLKNNATGLAESRTPLVKSNQTTLDRKDYVARLMAAKNKKPVGTPSQSANNIISSQIHSQSTSGSGSNFDTGTVAMAFEEKDIKAVQERRRAQTELARLRMEALQSKRTAKVSQSSEPSQQENAYPLQANHGLSTERQIENDISSQGKLSYSTRSTSINHQPSKPTNFSSFKAHSDSTYQTTDSFNQNQDYDMITNPIQIPGLNLNPPQRSKGNEAIPNISNGQGPELDLTFAPQMISGVRKRPVAADFDDETPIIVTKRPFGQLRDYSESEDIVIEASDDESTRPGNSQDSEEEGFAIYKTQTPRAANDIVMKPIDYSQNLGINNAASLDSGTISDSTQQSKDLKRHEEQINLMKRKIAEMVVKRKAKSVHSSIGTPATPFPQEYSSDTSRQGSVEHVAAFKSSEPYNVKQVEAAKTRESHIPFLIEPYPTTKSPDSEPAQNLESHLQMASPASRAPSLEHLDSREPSPRNDDQTTNTQKRSNLLPSHSPNHDVQNFNITHSSEGVDGKYYVQSTESLGRSKFESIFHASQLSHLTLEEHPDEDDAKVEMETARLDGSSDGFASSMSFSVQDTESPTQSNDEAELSYSQRINSPKPPGKNGEADSTLSPRGQVSLNSASDYGSSKADSVSEAILSKDRKDLEIAPLQVSTSLMETNGQDDYQMDENSCASSEIIESSESDSGLGKAIRDLTNADVELTGVVPSVATSPKDSASSSFLLSDEEYEPPDATDEDLSKFENPLPEDDDYEPPEITPSTCNPANDIATQFDHLKMEPPSNLENASPVDMTNSVELTTEHSFAEDVREGTPLFTPYDSPLKIFKSFRYHPEFLNNVPNGFRSTTYSHSIDPDQPLCPFEAAGGTCNDSKCAHQHFRSMLVGDEAILLQLGSRNPGSTREEMSRWTEGLKQVIQGLRSKKITDAHVVATEIASYRRRFLNDSSRVIDL